jgi:hypothetical protein
MDMRWTDIVRPDPRTAAAPSIGTEMRTHAEWAVLGTGNGGGRQQGARNSKNHVYHLWCQSSALHEFEARTAWYRMQIRLSRMGRTDIVLFALEGYAGCMQVVL